MFGRISMISAISSALLLAMPAAQELQTPLSAPGSRVSITVHGGRLSASIQNSPLPPILEELSTRTRVAIVPASGLDDEYLSAEIKGASIDDGVRQLLRNYDTFLYYSASGQQPSQSLTAVWVYPRGAGAALRPVPPSDWASTKDLEAAVNDRDPAVREIAYDALMSRADATSRNLIVLAIRGATETDTDVRQRLLSAALSRGIELPREILADLVRADGTDEIRVMALDALASDPEARPIVAGALTDPSALVRDRAKEVLLELDSSALRR